MIAFRTCQLTFMGDCNRVGSIVNGQKAVPKNTVFWRVCVGACGDQTISIGHALVSILA